MARHFVLEDRSGNRVLEFNSCTEVYRFIRTLRSPGVPSAEDAFRLVIVDGVEPSVVALKEVLPHGR